MLSSWYRQNAIPDKLNKVCIIIAPGFGFAQPTEFTAVLKEKLELPNLERYMYLFLFLGDKIMSRTLTNDTGRLFILLLLLNIHSTDAFSKLTKLTDGNGLDFSPKWSSDGSTIAFSRFKNDNEVDIILISGEGGDPEQLTHTCGFHPT